MYISSKISQNRGFLINIALKHVFLSNSKLGWGWVFRVFQGITFGNPVLTAALHVVVTMADIAAYAAHGAGRLYQAQCMANT